MKTALFLQPHGLGDCIFAQGIAKYFSDYQIYWPVKQFKQDLRRAYPSIAWCEENFSDLEAPIYVSGAEAVPIRWSDTIMRVPYTQVMRAKYDMFGLDWRIWRNYAVWQRDLQAESELFNIVVPRTPYRLISNMYTGAFKTKRINADPTDLQNVYLKPIGQYSLFDWAKVIEHATEIHAVASSNIYLFELLDLTAKDIYIYPRDVPHHDQYTYILQRHNYTLK